MKVEIFQKDRKVQKGVFIELSTIQEWLGFVKKKF